MLSVFKPSVLLTIIILNVIMLNVVMLHVNYPSASPETGNMLKCQTLVTGNTEIAHRKPEIC